VSEEQTGLEAPIVVWVDGLTTGTNDLFAVAVEASVLKQIESTAGRAMHIRRICPWWSIALNWAMSQSLGVQVLGIDDGDGITLLTGVGEEFVSVGSYEPMTKESLIGTLSRACWSVPVQPAKAALIHRTSQHASSVDTTGFGSRRPDGSFELQCSVLP
jgi:hypothetical protein